MKDNGAVADPVDIQRLGPDAVRSRISAGLDTVLVPIGACERHGNPHTPLGLDGMVSEAIAERAARSAGVLRTALLPLGYAPMHMGKEGDGCGAVTLRAETYRCVVEDVGRSLIYQGFDKVVYVSMHAPNVYCAEEVLYTLRERTGAFVAFYGGRESSAVDEIFASRPARLSSDIEAAMAMALLGPAFQTDQYSSRVYDIHAPGWLGGAFSKRAGTGSAVAFEGAENVHVGIQDYEYVSGSEEPPPPSEATAERGEHLLDSLSGHLARFLEEVKALQVEVRDRGFPDRAR